MIRERALSGILVVTIISFSGLKAQNAIVTTGGNATGAGGKVSYSVGQIAVVTNSSISEGVQKPYSNFVVGIDQAPDIKLSLSAYPNPSSNNIVLNTNGYELKNTSYKLIDIQGKLIEQQKIINVETVVAMEQLPPSTYILRISENNREIKSFKIIKH